MRKPSPSMIVALVALFVALGGAGVAANGGNFILGHSNSASKGTVLSAPVAGGKALQVTNANTSNAASTALGLNVASGHAPFTVNSGVKVANLNADLLDGLDSSVFQQRVGGTCASGSAVSGVNMNGSVTCQTVGSDAYSASAPFTGMAVPAGSYVILAKAGFTNVVGFASLNCDLEEGGIVIDKAVSSASTSTGTTNLVVPLQATATLTTTKELKVVCSDAGTGGTLGDAQLTAITVGAIH
jgi:hypothetical protein